MSARGDSLLFSAPLSSYDPGFWEELYRRKLNVYGLSTEAVPLRARALPATARQPCATLFARDSFLDEESESERATGALLHFNTIEAFGRCDKKALLRERGLALLDDMLSGEAVKNPQRLHQFVLLCFADLKNFKFVFWFASPVLTLAHPPVLSQHAQSLSAWNRDVQRCALTHALHSGESVFAVVCGEDASSECVCVSLAEAWATRHHTTRTHIVCLSSSLDEHALGWEARNLLVLLALHTHTDTHTVSEEAEREVSVIALRNDVLRDALAHTAQQSATRDVDIDELVAADASTRCVVKLSLHNVVGGDCDPHSLSHDALAQCVREKAQFVGWEPNDRGKPSPRLADLSFSLSPTHLAAQAVDLNLRLMKWRLWPSLHTDRLASLRVLLLGSGTLGCAVARTLLGWGVRSFTLVDNGRVSLSNPVRQSLFEHSDAQQRAFKAQAAADALRRIFPGVSAEGVVLSIPMPGHPYASSDSHSHTHAQNSAVLTDEAARARLHTLVAEHDVVFALTDSREARWLPTVLCALLDKPLLNVALGFDSFLAMRHHCSLGTTHSEKHKVGCYFCTDVVAAANSQRERALDQQCTVTRPGLSPVAAGLAVELAVSLLQQHWTRTESTPSDGGKDEEKEMRVPHQLRGSVWGFTQMSLETPAFPQCTACSSAVVSAYAADPALFTQRVCAEPQLLERVSGIEEMMRGVDVDNVDFDEDDGDDF